MLSFYSIQNVSDSSEEANSNLVDNGIIDLGGHPKTSKELIDLIAGFQRDRVSDNFEFQGYVFDRSSLLRLLSLDKCEGIAFYLAKHIVNDKEAFTVISIPVDADAQFLVSKIETTINGTKTIEEGIFGEEDSTGHPPKILLDFLEKINRINS